MDFKNGMVIIGPQPKLLHENLPKQLLLANW